MWKQIRHKGRAVGDRAGIDRELESEVRFHLDMEAARLVSQGRSPEQARDAGTEEFWTHGPNTRKKRAMRAA